MHTEPMYVSKCVHVSVHGSLFPLPRNEQGGGGGAADDFMHLHYYYSVGDSAGLVDTKLAVLHEYMQEGSNALVQPNILSCFNGLFFFKSRLKR